jgi:hypothetical protein
VYDKKIKYSIIKMFNVVCGIQMEEKRRSIIIVINPLKAWYEKPLSGRFETTWEFFFRYYTKLRFFDARKFCKILGKI